MEVSVSTLETALYYYDAGLMPMPVRDKIPLVKWGEFHEQRPERAVVEGWFRTYPNADIGVVTGPVSGILVLDVDGEEGRQSSAGLGLRGTWHNRTRNGQHYFYRWQDMLVPTTVTELLGSVDVRGQGGYVVVNAEGYQWEAGQAPWEIALAPCPDWLIQKLAERAQPKENSPTEEGWLSKLLDGVEEGGRHAALVKLTSYYLSRMPADVARKLILEWNEKNNPPMSDDEIDFQFSDIAARFRSGRYQSAFAGDSVMTMQAPELTLLSATDVMNKFSGTIEWLVDGLIPRGTSTLFAGWQGRGKSWLIADLAAEIAKGGGKWFGHLDAPAGRVLYVDNENAGNLISRRLQRLLPGKGVTADQLQLGFFIRNRIKLTNSFHMQQLKQKIAEEKPTLVVIDSFASCHTLDENSSKDMRYFFDDLIAPIIDEYGCSFIFIDHENKGQVGVEMHGSKRLRGSGAKGDAADVLLSLNEREGVLVLEHSKARYSKKFKPMAVSIDDTEQGVEISFRGYLG
jgi:hypothetical protein